MRAFYAVYVVQASIAVALQFTVGAVRVVNQQLVHSLM